MRSARLLAITLVLALVAPAAAQRGASTIATSQIFEALELQPGQTVGEIGAGQGQQTIDAARAVGPQGKAYSSELGDDRVKALERRMTTSGLSQIIVVAGDPDRTNFPDACCDAIFMRNVYHHFADPAAMNGSIVRSLKPGGRIAVVDFEPARGRPEAARPADRGGNENHGVTPASVARELQDAGLEIVRSEPAPERWFIVVARKPAPRF